MTDAGQVLGYVNLQVQGIRKQLADGEGVAADVQLAAPGGGRA